MMTPLLDKLRRYGTNEDGAGTVFGLYIFCLMLMIFGLAIDVANAWRNRTLLMTTADIAAHAGAVGIENGESQAQIKADMAAMIQANMPSTFYGTTIDTSTDISFGEYDVEKYGWSSMGGSNYNGVVVKLQRTRAYGNPVTNFVMGLTGNPTFDLSARSAAVFDKNGKCDMTNGVFAQDTVTLTTQAYVGSGYCLHSNDAVWLPQQNTFADNTMVTMAKQNGCKDKCNDTANPGIKANIAYMKFPDIGAYILDAYNSFRDDDLTYVTSGYKYNWFTKETDTSSIYYDVNDPLITLGDTTDLILGVASLTSPPSLGDVITMTPSEFLAFDKPLPSGLVYDIDCTKVGGQNGNKITKLTFDATHGVMNGGALTTNCQILFDVGSSVVKSVIITINNDAAGAISANEGTTMGDPTNDCHNDERSAIMSLGDVTVPADFTLSNLTLIVDGNMNVAAISAAAKSGVNKASYGFAVYASGYAKFASKQTFYSCPGSTDMYAPELKYLRIVVPPGVDSSGNFVTGVYLNSDPINTLDLLLQNVTPGFGMTDGAVTVSNASTTSTTTTDTTLIYP